MPPSLRTRRNKKHNFTSNMNISELLNPQEDEVQRPQPHSKPVQVGRPVGHAIQKGKQAKDQPIYRKQQPLGEVNFLPYNAAEQSELFKIHHAHKLLPNGKIEEYANYVPYASEKKLFHSVTGRYAFDLFNYQFTLPSDAEEKGKTYYVSWDYRIGLVRMTHLFKACNLAKTVPAKSLAVNPGLKEISHSITGGSLQAQGYWVPYEAARAIAATFCWNIRFLLTPVFGEDFPDQCLPPDDPKFENFKINPEIVDRCTKQTKTFRERLETGAATPLSSNTAEPEAPAYRPSSREWTPPLQSSPTHTRLNGFSDFHHHHHHHRMMTPDASPTTPEIWYHPLSSSERGPQAASSRPATAHSIVSQDSQYLQVGRPQYSPEVSPKSQPLHLPPLRSVLYSTGENNVPAFKQPEWTPVSHDQLQGAINPVTDKERDAINGLTRLRDSFAPPTTLDTPQKRRRRSSPPIEATESTAESHQVPKRNKAEQRLSAVKEERSTQIQVPPIHNIHARHHITKAANERASNALSHILDQVNPIQ